MQKVLLDFFGFRPDAQIKCLRDPARIFVIQKAFNCPVMRDIFVFTYLQLRGALAEAMRSIISVKMGL